MEKGKYSLDEITEIAKKDSILYHAIEKLFEKDKSGLCEIDRIKKYKYDFESLSVKERSKTEAKLIEQDAEILKRALNQWLEIPLMTSFEMFEPATLTAIIANMNFEIKGNEESADY